MQSNIVQERAQEGANPPARETKAMQFVSTMSKQGDICIIRVPKKRTEAAQRFGKRDITVIVREVPEEPENE
jgi:hypothetical protein